jgi:hypothetical protein
VGGFRRIGSCRHLGLLNEVSPARVMIGGALRLLEFLQDRFSFSLASDYRDHSGRAVRSDVVQDDREGMIRVVECQKESIAELGKVDCTASLLHCLSKDTRF